MYIMYVLLNENWAQQLFFRWTLSRLNSNYPIKSRQASNLDKLETSGPTDANFARGARLYAD